MKAHIQKWGNSLAVRIPKSFAVEMHLEPGSTVDLSLVDGKLVIKPLTDPRFLLQDLLAGVTQDNRHQEVESLPKTGKEVS